MFSVVSALSASPARAIATSFWFLLRFCKNLPPNSKELLQITHFSFYLLPGMCLLKEMFPSQWLAIFLISLILFHVRLCSGPGRATFFTTQTTKALGPGYGVEWHSTESNKERSRFCLHFHTERLVLGPWLSYQKTPVIRSLEEHRGLSCFLLWWQ